MYHPLVVIYLDGVDIEDEMFTGPSSGQLDWYDPYTNQANGIEGKSRGSVKARPQTAFSRKSYHCKRR